MVRLARPDEIALVWQLMLAGFDETRSFPLPSSALEENLDDVRRAIGGGGAVIAFSGDEAVGCARFRVAAATLTFSRMTVVPRARGAGIGAALVGYLEAHARRLGLAAVELTARSEQPDNRPFYEELGYRVVGYSERYGLPKLSTHMRKTLG